MSELFLIAHLAGRWVAVAASQVDSAVDIGEVVAVPCAPPAVRGLAALRSRLGAAGRRLVVDTYSWERCAAPLDDLYGRVVTAQAVP